MISTALLLEHLGALVLVWSCAFLAGMPLASLLRVRLGFSVSILLGVAYWSVSLYVFPFTGGLYLAMALAGIAALIVWIGAARPTFRPTKPHEWVLIVGCGSYASLLCTNYVPPGMDASMHTTSARLIAEQAGLPQTYAPFAPELFFPAVNLGLPTLAAAAIRLGCTPPAAMLAAEQLAFAAFILATYLVLRLWTPRLTAASLAVLAAWTSRGMQETVGWGGFPTVMSVALGLCATRLLIDILRRPAYRSAWPLGILIASLPLVHGVSAAVWVYAIAPVAFVVALARSRRRRQGLATLAGAGAIALVILIAYRAVGATGLQESEIEWTRNWQEANAPKGAGWTFLFIALGYIKSYAGSMMVWLGVVSGGWLLLRGRFRPVLALTCTALLLALLVVNVRYWALPFSMLLYPERVVYWATPLAALAIGLGLRALPMPPRRWVTVGLVVALLVPALIRHAAGYQRVATRPEVTRSGWEMLQWARRHLDPDHDFVGARYNTAGSYLPAVAGVGTTGWHAHHFLQEEFHEAWGKRSVTHVVVARDQPIPRASDVVFQNDECTIIRLPAPAQARGQAAPVSDTANPGR